jgi:hypothetical protein
MEDITESPSSTIMPPTMAPSPKTITTTTTAREDVLVHFYTVNVPRVAVMFSGSFATPSLSLDDTVQQVYEDLVSSWFDDYFVATTTDRRRETYGIRNMTSHLVVTDQVVTATSNTITYTQNLFYYHIAAAVLETTTGEQEGSSPTPPLPLSPEDIVRLPYRDELYRLDLIPLLQNRVQGFGPCWDGTVHIPEVLVRGTEPPILSATNVSSVALMGLAGIGAVVLLVSVAVSILYSCYQSHRIARQFTHDDDDQVELPVAHGVLVQPDDQGGEENRPIPLVDAVPW